MALGQGWASPWLVVSFCFAQAQPSASEEGDFTGGGKGGALPVPEEGWAALASWGAPAETIDHPVDTALSCWPGGC